MTQRNIDVMDIIVSEMNEGTKLSKALKLVYTKRKVRIPCSLNDFDIFLIDLNMSGRTTNALLRAKLRTLKDVVNFCRDQKITDIKTLGANSGIEVFETILDYCWDHMDSKERTSFLIDTVKMNEDYIRVEIA